MSEFDKLKRLTDADTDSEVFRNALRLHAALVRAYLKGDTVQLRRKKGGGVETVALFDTVSTEAVRPRPARSRQRPPSAGNG
jgi:hypothetical protein